MEAVGRGSKWHVLLSYGEGRLEFMKPKVLGAKVWRMRSVIWLGCAILDLCALLHSRINTKHETCSFKV